jgi:hypothetical protein
MDAVDMDAANDIDAALARRYLAPDMGGLVAPHMVGVNVATITLDSVRDNIVSKSTSRSYIPDILLFCFWCRKFAVDCLTDFCITMLDDFSFEFPGEKASVVVSKKKEQFKTFLRDACNTPLFYLDLLHPLTYMSFVITLKKKTVIF